MEAARLPSIDKEQEHVYNYQDFRRTKDKIAYLYYTKNQKDLLHK